MKTPEHALTSRPIVCLGEVLWDIFPGNKPLLGGAPANVCFQCAALGHSSALVSAVGDDSHGRSILHRLEQSGLPIDWVGVDPNHPTGRVLVDVDLRGQPSYEILGPVAWDQLHWSGSLQRLAGRAQAVCFGTLAQRHSVSRETIQRFLSASRHCPVRLLDLNLRGDDTPQDLIAQSLALANMAKFNRAEFEIVSRMAQGPLHDSLESQARILLRVFDLEAVWITLGAQGSLMVSESETLHQTAHECLVVDTVGAGDAFCAGLLCGLVRQDPIAAVTRLAARLAARACSTQGALPSLGGLETPDTTQPSRE